jgi:head-tail adaptor
MPEVSLFGRDAKARRDPLIIDAGELRHFIRIERASQTPDSFGKSINPATWDEVLTTWGALYTAGGRETAMASHIVSAVSHVVKIRWTPIVVLRANYRVLIGPRYFTVSYVENVRELNFVLLLYAVEIDKGGI